MQDVDRRLIALESRPVEPPKSACSWCLLQSWKTLPWSGWLSRVDGFSVDGPSGGCLLSKGSAPRLLILWTPSEIPSEIACWPRYFIIPVGAATFKEAMQIGAELSSWGNLANCHNSRWRLQWLPKHPSDCFLPVSTDYPPPPPIFLQLHPYSNFLNYH